LGLLARACGWRAQTRAVATDGTVAATLLFDAVSREKPPVYA
jgi:hypothetical protein